MADLVIPARLAATVVRWEGDRGRAWLAELPELVRAQAAAWELDVGAPFAPGGNISWVAPVRRRDGSEAVLKLQHPHPESEPEASALRAWAGRGAVRLLDHHPERCALLLERCRPGTDLTELGGSLDAVRAGAAIGARLHAVPAPADIPWLASVLDPWADELASGLEQRPWPDAAIGRRAVATIRERPRACPEGVLLHGDLNPTNVLAAAREPWLAIDPKPMVGDPARDGARLVLQPHPGSARVLAERVAVVVDTMGVDREALVEWCLVDAVEMATASRSHGDEVAGAQGVEQVRLLRPLLS